MNKTYLRTKIAAGVCGLGLVASTLCMAATPAFAEVVTGKTGMTDVIVKADESNMKFEVPTVIPFAADAEGLLTGPDPASIQIKNLSSFRIHLENMKVESVGDWNIYADEGQVAAAETNNNIAFAVGPEGNLKNAADAMIDDGLDLSGDQTFDLAYMGAQTGDKVDLHTTGVVGRVLDGNVGAGTQVAQITWTFGAGGAVN